MSFLPLRPQASTWLAILMFGAVYAVTARIGLTYSLVAANVTLIWPPTGIALFALLRWGPRLWPGIVVGDLLANFDTGIPAWAILGISLGNLLQTGIALAVLRSQGFDPALGRVRDVLALFVVGVGGAAVSACIGPAFLVAAGAVEPGRYAYTWLIWCMGDGAGVVVVAPALLAWDRWRRARPGKQTPAGATAARPAAAAGWVEAAWLGTTLLLACTLVFGGMAWLGQGYHPASLVLFPVAIWAALRFGVRGAATASLLIAVAAIWGTVHGRGPFADATPLGSTLRWWVFANVIAATSLLIASSISERRRATAALQEAHAELEARVAERTRELADSNTALRAEMVERRRLEGELISASEREQMRIGQELHDGLGQQLTGVALLGEVLHRRLRTQGLPEAEQARRIEALVSEAVSHTRLLARGLFPVELEAHGLMSALEQLAVNTRRLHDVRCIFRCDQPVLLEDREDRATAIHLYRIAQEAITNALKHSQARNLLIELQRDADGIRLSVRDDGVGLRAPGGQADGMGLRTMHYRANLIGAELHVGPPAAALAPRNRPGLLVRVSLPRSICATTEPGTARHAAA